MKFDAEIGLWIFHWLLLMVALAIPPARSRLRYQGWLHWAGYQLLPRVFIFLSIALVPLRTQGNWVTWWDGAEVSQQFSDTLDAEFFDADENIWNGQFDWLMLPRIRSSYDGRNFIRRADKCYLLAFTSIKPNWHLWRVQISAAMLIQLLILVLERRLVTNSPRSWLPGQFKY